MPPAATLSIVIWLLVLVWILLRQIRVRRVRTRLLVPVVLIVIGVADMGSAHSSAISIGGTSAVGGTVSSGILAVTLLAGAGLGVLRASTVKLWRSGSDIMRQGTWITVALWLVSIAVHVSLDGVGGGVKSNDVSSLLLYLGVTLAAQQLTVTYRSRAVAESEER